MCFIYCFICVLFIVFIFPGSVSALHVKNIISKKRKLSNNTENRKKGAISYKDRYTNIEFKVVEYAVVNDGTVDTVISTGKSLCFRFFIFIL